MAERAITEKIKCLTRVKKTGDQPQLTFGGTKQATRIVSVE
jgi:hypothetical protein